MSTRINIFSASNQMTSQRQGKSVEVKFEVESSFGNIGPFTSSFPLLKHVWAAALSPTSSRHLLGSNELKATGCAPSL